MNTHFFLKMVRLGAALAALGAAVPLGCGDSEDNGDDTDEDEDSDSDTDSDSETDVDTGTDLPETCEGGRLDPDTGLCWQNPISAERTTWDAAVSFCNDLVLGGHNDWFLPRRDDFLALFDGCDEDVLGGDWGYCDECASSEKCSALFGDDERRYWASDEGFECVWGTDFLYTESKSKFVCDTGDFVGSYYRCVRREFPVDAGVDGGE